MNLKKVVCLLPALAMMVFMGTSCGKHHRPDPTAKWGWEPASPPMPATAWVAAGPFRKAQRAPGDIVAIVIHTTEGGYKDNLSFEENQKNSFAGNINYFKANDRSVSAHFVMGPKGEICNMVNETDIAHTQTYYNGRGIGIECAGWADKPETWTPEMVDSLVELCAYLCVKWDVPAYHPEGTAYEGPYALVIDDDNKRFTGHGLVGHYQIQPWNKSDPGKYFPWEEFGERVRARIRKYGVEPIELPSPEETAKEVYATARIKEEVAHPGAEFTYEVTILGPGADKVNAADIQFPDFAETSGLVAGEPQKLESSEKRAVFEVKLTPSEVGKIAFHAARVNMDGRWIDSPTVNVQVE